MSARSAVALDEGVNEDMLATVDDHRTADYSEQHHAALTLADSYLGSPAHTSDADREQIAAHLQPQQVVEIVLKLVGFSSDKVMVALGLDLDEVKIFTMK